MLEDDIQPGCKLSIISKHAIEPKSAFTVAENFDRRLLEALGTHVVDDWSYITLFSLNYYAEDSYIGGLFRRGPGYLQCGAVALVFKYFIYIFYCG